MAECDDDIIRRAQLWATGATIHNVNQLIGWYRSAAECLDRPPENEEQKAHAERFLAWSYKVLTDYMPHGNYSKAKEDNPFS